MIEHEKYKSRSPQVIWEQSMEVTQEAVKVLSNTVNFINSNCVGLPHHRISNRGGN